MRCDRRSRLLGGAKRSWIAILLFALVVLLPTENASAAQITYQSVAGIWHDPTDNVPGVQPGDPVITNGTPTSIVTWGTTSGTPQSSYDFTAAIPPPFALPGPIPFFSLGSFTHRNFAVSDPSLTSIQLDVVLVINVDGVPRPPLTFTFTFHHEETLAGGSVQAIAGAEQRTHAGIAAARADGF